MFLSVLKRLYLFVVHIGEIDSIHLHYLISNLDFKKKRNKENIMQLRVCGKEN